MAHNYESDFEELESPLHSHNAKPSQAPASKKKQSLGHETAPTGSSKLRNSAGPTRNPSMVQVRKTSTLKKGKYPLRSQLSIRSTNKNTNLSPRQSMTSRPRQFNVATLTAAGNFDEIARLVGIIDEQKIQIAKLVEERKTMKIVTQRQDRALQQMSKDQTELPKLVRSLNDELRVIKTERSRDRERAAQVERNAQLQVEENVRLQTLVYNLQATVRNRKLENSEKLKAELDRTRKELASRETTIQELERTIRHKDGAKSGDLREALKRIIHSQNELEVLQAKYESTVQRLQDRERENAALSIYAQAALRQRTKDRKVSGLSLNESVVSSSPTPHLDASGRRPMPTVRQSLNGPPIRSRKTTNSEGSHSQRYRSLSPSHLKDLHNSKLSRKPSLAKTDISVDHGYHDEFEEAPDEEEEDGVGGQMQDEPGVADEGKGHHSKEIPSFQTTTLQKTKELKVGKRISEHSLSLEQTSTPLAGAKLPQDTPPAAAGNTTFFKPNLFAASTETNPQTTSNAQPEPSHANTQLPQSLDSKPSEPAPPDNLKKASNETMVHGDKQKLQQEPANTIKASGDSSIGPTPTAIQPSSETSSLAPPSSTPATDASRRKSFAKPSATKVTAPPSTKKKGADEHSTDTESVKSSTSTPTPGASELSKTKNTTSRSGSKHKLDFLKAQPKAITPYASTGTLSSSRSNLDKSGTKPGADASLPIWMQNSN
ncbi:ciliary protein causing Leber congenital amaurosis disease-domain-containing protein [Phlyctochytrium arcticum]|nr:ciliary protein causing Leber congenital amaurosis disease-domain-containing protein [Phlyctochytrium arcticum]